MGLSFLLQLVRFSSWQFLCPVWSLHYTLFQSAARSVHPLPVFVLACWRPSASCCQGFCKPGKRPELKNKNTCQPLRITDCRHARLTAFFLPSALGRTRSGSLRYTVAATRYTHCIHSPYTCSRLPALPQAGFSFLLLKTLVDLIGGILPRAGKYCASIKV